MPEFIAQLERGKLWDFSGGIHPPEMKDQSSAQPLRRLSLPDALIIPLQQHIGPQGDLLVNVGEQVLKGQPLTRGSGRTLPVHASTSGLITHIDLFTTAHPSGLPETCIRLVPDGLDRWVERQPLADYLQYSPESLVDLIHQAGIAGLGGAGFPTSSKLNGGLSMIDVLIVNGAECEPYITADDRLMREHADEIILGCEILCHILKPRLVILGIEDNKPEAIKAIRQALSGNQRVMLRVVPTKYPSGGAKQLTKILTGREIPFGHHSADIGVLMQNVGTAFAIKRAIVDGEPLIERVVTLTGDTVTDKGNYWVRLGTPVSHLLHSGGYSITSSKATSSRMVIMGGPLMGFTLPHLDVPVVKITNCILAPSMQEISPPAAEQACIRCTLCVEACPAGLLPQQLYWFSKGQQHEKARDYHLFDCIECGACAYVCPSNIPLVQYYRQEKAEIRELDKENERAQRAKARFEAKQARLEREKLARQDRHKQAAVKLDQSDRDAVAAALARVQAKQQSTTAAVEPTAAISIQTIGNTPLPDNSPAILAKTTRRLQASQQQPAQENEPNTLLLNSDDDRNLSSDPRKMAVAETTARAKAKKAELQKPAADSLATVTEPTISEPIDPRKAAVAEAIARAKAKKAALQKPAADSPATVTEPTVSEPIDPRKAAVAEAIARAKAKKAALQKPAADSPATVTEPTVSEPIDPRKAAVAEAIARAKAKKAALAARPSSHSEE